MLKYASVERERRWLCTSLPEGLSQSAQVISDLYITGSRLRLRTVQTSPDGAVVYKLTKKADLSPDRRLITTLYLTAVEHALFADLPGPILRKTRRRLAVNGATLAVDVFEGALAGLALAEAEFETDEAMAAFCPPAWLSREVTADPRYTGGRLASEGLPASLMPGG